MDVSSAWATVIVTIIVQIVGWGSAWYSSARNTGKVDAKLDMIGGDVQQQGDRIVTVEKEIARIAGFIDGRTK